LTPGATPSSRSSTSPRIAACRGSDIFVQPAGGANTAGTRPAGADAKAAPTPEAHQKLEGPLEVSVDFHGDEPEPIAAALKGAGAKAVRTT
jgi:hypothetical protein